MHELLDNTDQEIKMKILDSDIVDVTSSFRFRTQHSHSTAQQRATQHSSAAHSSRPSGLL
jgi:hypothetical protein